MRIIKYPLLAGNESVSVEGALEVFNALTEEPEHFLGQGWTNEEVFWSRYFWIRVYGNLTRIQSGPDAGLEQFIFKVLEAPAPACDPDWSCAQVVDELAAQETND